MTYLLAIDQGTTSSRAVVVDARARIVATASQELTQHYPQAGWVEHDPEEIWESVARVVPRALEQAGIRGTDLAALGVTNQRETVLLWERSSGRAVTPALVWQDRRTADFCRQRAADEPWLRQRTGLVLDPYFSATKLHWLLSQDAGLRHRALAGQLAAGTIDSWLLWRLTGGREHLTDRSNASRTLLLNLHRADWDEELCRYFAVPTALLPRVLPSGADFGVTRGLDFLPEGIPIRAVAGDQQAALIGQGGFAAGDAKCTYGTGAFFLCHLGTEPRLSAHRLLTSVAASATATPEYVLEGSVFVAGAALQWLRDQVKLLSQAADSEMLARQSDPAEAVLLVPAFTGLGAPYWVPEARGVLFGLSRRTTAADLVRAALEGVAFQVADLIAAADADLPQPVPLLRADGGMADNAWFLQRQADLLGRPIQAAVHREATALGVAFLAGLHLGLWSSPSELIRLLTPGPCYQPRWSTAERQRRLDEWRRAVQAVIAFYRS
jgi:glycerol kinase